jgi:hypothetical protein
MWFNNKQGSTHTIYITDDGFYIEATPPTEGSLDYIYVAKVNNIKDIVKNMAKQCTDMYWKDSPRYRYCKYIPDNKVETIDQFIDKRWIDGQFD